jgi:hypothetical protein
MIQAALTPLSDVQHFCKVWQGEYFPTYGDITPNNNETLLALMQKSDVYDKYVLDMNRYSKDFVSYKTFVSLWNAIYPFCLIRSSFLLQFFYFK